MRQATPPGAPKIAAGATGGGSDERAFAATGFRAASGSSRRAEPARCEPGRRPRRGSGSRPALGCATTPTPPPERNDDLVLRRGRTRRAARHDPPRSGDRARRHGSARWHDLARPDRRRSGGRPQRRRDRVRRRAAHRALQAGRGGHGFAGDGEQQLPSRCSARCARRRASRCSSRRASPRPSRAWAGPVFTGSERSIRVVRSGSGETVVYRVDLYAIQNGRPAHEHRARRGRHRVRAADLLGRIGYVVQAVLFPFNPLLGLGTTVAGVAIGQ